MGLWIIIVALLICVIAVLALDIVSLTRRMNYLRNVIFSLTNGTLFNESLSTVSAAYGLEPEELIFIIENHQNVGEKK